MAEQRVQRRLAAILVADVVGYSRLMGADETGTLARIRELRSELIEPKVADFGGRVVKTTGDGFMKEFPSAVDAVQLAIDLQRALTRRNTNLAEDQKIELRIGLNLGDVMVDGDDLMGDGINVAARIEALADPGGIFLSDMVHAGVRGKLNVEFEDLGDQALKNIAEPVRVWRVCDDATAEAKLGGPDDAIFRRPAVAVLPFENLSGDPEQDYFVDGLTEDIITALSLWRSFPVIARNSTFAYKGTSPDIRKVGEELGARYVIEGSVRKAGSRIRVTAQLINAPSGHHVWAEQFDRELDDIFALQDEITHRIAATVAPELESAEARNVVDRSPVDLDAWDAVQRGFSILNDYTKPGILAARDMFERAIAIDPNYARGFVGVAFTHNREFTLGFSDSFAESLSKCADAANHAVLLDDSDSMAHSMLAIVCNWQRDFERGVSEAELAIQLNPSDSFAYALVGIITILSGRPDEGLPWLERALRLNPRATRQPLWLGFIARAHFTARRYDEAVEWARRAVNRQPAIPDLHLILAASLGQFGDADGASEALGRCESVRPGYTSNPEFWYPYALTTDWDHFVDGLHKAGWVGEA